MADRLELSEQLEHHSVENNQTLTQSTSYPSGKPSERTSIKVKSSKSVKLKLFPFSWAEIFHCKFMAL